MENNEILMSLKDVNMVFKKPGSFVSDKYIHVLKDVSLDIYKGEILAVVGESGCGKTTLGKIITGLYKPTSGSVTFEGQDLYGLLSRTRRPVNTVQFIQQDSYAALNPVRTIYQSLYAPIKNYHRKWNRLQIDAKIDELMKEIALYPADQYLSKYPHQLSGGQRQRILMARAISLEPKLIVADEPVSMIDVSLRLSLLNLMKELKDKHDMSFVYISHDIATTRYITESGRVAVMYLGEIVELGKIADIISAPKHPYTRALIQAVPVPDPSYVGNDNLPLKSMNLGTLENRGEGCPFYERCLYSTDKCLSKVPMAHTETSDVMCCNLDAIPKNKIFERRDGTNKT
jgi:peptide/nickel transport system ATP-binding protein